MGSSDSLSFPSEPPDIANWFSSYVHQSPELSSIDDFKDCRVSGGNDLGDNEEEKEEKDFLLLDVKKSSISHLNSCEDNKFTSEGLGSSEDLSFSTEPPDIKNWFSSYEYESPALDSSDAFMISDQNDSNYTVQENDARYNTNKKEEDFRDFPEALICDLSGKGILSAGLVKCIHKVKDNKNEDQQVSEHCGEANENQSLNGNLKRGENDDNGSTIYIRSNKGGEKRDLDTNSSGGSQRLLQIKNDSDYNGKNSPRKLISVAGSFRAKHATELMRPMANGKSSKEATGGSNEKENYANKFSENGFVSTRNSKTILACSENYLRKPLGFQSSSSKAGRMTDSLSTKDDGLVRRKILSETTNFRPPDILEIPGKWRCPKKNKPDLGPPLKQLRLEQWIRRV